LTMMAARQMFVQKCSNLCTDQPLLCIKYGADWPRFFYPHDNDVRWVFLFTDEPCMTPYALPLLGILLLAAQASQAAPAHKTSLDAIWLTASSQNYSEASAIYQMVENTWKDQPPATGRTAFSRNRFSIGMRERWVS